MNNLLKDVLFLLTFFGYWLLILFLVLIVGLMFIFGVEVSKASGTEVSVSCVDYEAMPPNYYISMSTDQDIYVEAAAQEGNVLMLGDWALSGGDEWGFVVLDVDSWLRLDLWAGGDEPAVVASLSIDGNDHSFPQCGAEGWKPGAPSVPVIDPPSDCFWVFIRNEDYDNNPETASWTILADDNNPDGILFHYGDAIIANPQNGQSTDPNDYVAEETACF